jgi:hypothetical protein
MVATVPSVPSEDDAIPIRIADAVVAEINAAVTAEEFSTLGFTAVRSYADWDEKFSDLVEGIPRVDVVFRAETSPELEDQSALDYEVSIDVALRCRFGQEDRDNATGRLKNESIDPLVTLAEQMHEHFVSDRNGTTLPNEPTATWQQSDVKLYWDRKKIREGLFYSWFRLVFSISKDI